MWLPVEWYSHFQWVQKQMWVTLHSASYENIIAVLPCITLLITHITLNLYLLNMLSYKYLAFLILEWGSTKEVSEQKTIKAKNRSKGRFAKNLLQKNFFVGMYSMCRQFKERDCRPHTVIACLGGGMFTHLT